MCKAIHDAVFAFHGGAASPATIVRGKDDGVGTRQHGAFIARRADANHAGAERNVSSASASGGLRPSLHVSLAWPMAAVCACGLSAADPCVVVFCLGTGGRIALA